MLKRIQYMMIVVPMALVASIGVQADDSPFVNPGPDAGMVSGWNGLPAQDIHPVTFIELDGRNINARDVIWLKPGKYELTVRSNVRSRFGLGIPRRGRVHEEKDHNRIELVVEPGKAYYIGMKHNRQDRRSPYNAVLYRVEDERD